MTSVFSTSPSSSSTSNGGGSNGKLLAVGLATLAATYSAWLFYRRQASSTKSGVDHGSIRKSIQERGSASDNSQEALIEQRFQACVVQMKSQLPKLSYTQQLSYYGLYKQAAIGDYDEYQPHGPSRLDVVATKKYEAWKSRKGMTRFAAMQEYIDKVITYEFTKEMMNLDDEDDDGGDLEGEAIMDVQGLGNHVSTLAGSTSCDVDDGNPIHAAARRGDVDELTKLLNDGATNIDEKKATKPDVNQTDDAGQSPLHLAADQGNLNCVKLLILNGANIHATDNDGISVLQAAVIGGSVDVTKLLLAVGANPDQQDNDGDTPRTEADNEGNEMHELFDEHDEGRIGPNILDNDFVHQLEKNGVVIPKSRSKKNEEVAAEKNTTSNKRVNVEEELKNLSTIQITLDDSDYGDM